MPESQPLNKPASDGLPSVAGSIAAEGLRDEVNAKQEFEIKKLELEIANLRRWWIQPGFIQAVFGALLGCGTLLTGYFNGWFDVQRARLAVETAQLMDKRNELQINLTKAADTGARLAYELEKTKAALIQEAQAHDKAEKARQEQQSRTQSFSAALVDLTKRLSSADASVKEKVDNLNRQWSAIATNRALEAATYKAFNDRLMRENEQLRAQLKKRSETPSQSKGETASQSKGETYHVEGEVPLQSYDANISAEATLMANGTPELIRKYNNATPDQKRELEVKAVLDHLEVVNQNASHFIDWNKETKKAISRNIP